MPLGISVFASHSLLPPLLYIPETLRFEKYTALELSNKLQEPIF